MSVNQILERKGRDVVTLHPDVTLEEVAQVLARKRIGAIVLLEDSGRVAGIVSERDIVRVIGTAGVAALAHGVRDEMTMDVKTCTGSTGIDEAMQIMTEGRFRHLPVCENGKLTGIISIGDVVKRRIEDVEREAAEMREYIAS
ncbi:CBS domain-containing protein [Aurantimonas endophytica]|jgi:CBS domain-containing protein|uniref:CBS domain-containing protein n=1 Tax=Aurantimonas endophytica TaxID=1522175 RepID=A0A7W6HA39_9HYPH|nr:CBS domain-containing protein [Aurantimonas endophytica]MBB4001358.1 CBS domain-containing protein [Aurantimonas endophytica]MCO6402999.1 CBS domain-containing protein [Aurantimonas endophytica]